MSSRMVEIEYWMVAAPLDLTKASGPYFTITRAEAANVRMFGGLGEIIKQTALAKKAVAKEKRV